MVAACEPLCVPTFCPPKITVPGICNCPGDVAAPVPESVTFCVPLVALEVIAMDALRAPAAVGWNLIPIEQAPGLTLPLHELDEIEKSAVLVPVIENGVAKLTAAVLMVTVIVSVEFEPTLTLPNDTGFGAVEMAPAPPPPPLVIVPPQSVLGSLTLLSCFAM